MNNWMATTRHDLIIEVWEALDCESVGGHELEQIQQVLGEKFGIGAVESPASIARVVADEGAVLRHPEVFECDLKWREALLGQVGELDFSDLTSALDSFRRVEELRHELQAESDEVKLSQLREALVAAQQNCLVAGRSKVIAARQREEAKEIGEWLRVWLLTPDLFGDWLDLRMRSDDFRSKFQY